MITMNGIGSLKAGSGIDAVETRMRQIESLIQSVNPKPVANQQAFSSFLQPEGHSPGSTSVTGSLPERAKKLQPLIQTLSDKYQMDADLVNAVVQQESGFNPNAVSKAGATGLMQLMPGTAQGLGVSNPTDPAQNLDGGIRHLKNLITHYHGNIPLALAAYNAGMGAVKKHHGIPPYQETQHYVKTILKGYLSQKNQNPPNS